MPSNLSTYSWALKRKRISQMLWCIFEKNPIYPRLSAVLAHGQSLRHFLNKVTWWHFQSTSKEVIWPKKNFWITCMAKLESAYSFMLKYSKITVWAGSFLFLSVCVMRSSVSGSEVTKKPNAMLHAEKLSTYFRIALLKL